jgi:hypothetical protein
VATRSTSAGNSPATWLVTLAPGARIDQVAVALTAAGLSVTSTLDAVGVIVGTAPKGALPALRQVKGVANVSPDREVSVGLPDDPETW